jgi:hypothetical protein
MPQADLELFGYKETVRVLGETENSWSLYRSSFFANIAPNRTDLKERSCPYLLYPPLSFPLVAAAVVISTGMFVVVNGIYNIFYSLDVYHYRGFIYGVICILGMANIVRPCLCYYRKTQRRLKLCLAACSSGVVVRVVNLAVSRDDVRWCLTLLYISLL